MKSQTLTEVAAVSTAAGTPKKPRIVFFFFFLGFSSSSSSLSRFSEIDVSMG